MTTASSTVADPVARALAQLLADEMSGLKMVHDAMLDIAATVDDAGEYIDVTVTRRPFHAPDTSLRVLLHVTEPMTSEYTDDEPEVSVDDVGVMDESSEGEST